MRFSQHPFVIPQRSQKASNALTPFSREFHQQLFSSVRFLLAMDAISYHVSGFLLPEFTWLRHNTVDWGARKHQKLFSHTSGGQVQVQGTSLVRSGEGPLPASQPILLTVSSQGLSRVFL